MTFLETAARLLSLVQADMENGYRCAIEEVALLDVVSANADVVYLACDIVTALRHCEDGWISQSKVTFSRDELYDLWEAGLIDEPCMGERLAVNFMLRDE